LLLTVAVLEFSDAGSVEDARENLLQHVKSGSKPDVVFWNLYTAAYKSQMEVKKPITAMPSFKWAQTRTKLFITVAIPSVSGEIVNFTENSIHVSGKSLSDEKDYELKLTLFKAIKPGKSSFTTDGKAIYLTMKKFKKESYWGRPLKDKPTGDLKRKMEVDWSRWVDEEDLKDEDDEIDEDDVKVLGQADFDTWIDNTKLAMVEFYAPWCGHCKSLKPEYAKAATELRESGSLGQLAKVDATAHTKLGERFGVTGYPSIKVFLNGRVSDPLSYDGARNQYEIVKYMKKREAPAVKVLRSDAELDNFVCLEPLDQRCETPDGQIVYFSSEGTSDEKSASFTAVAEALRDEFSFGQMKEGPYHVTHRKLKGEGRNQIVLFKRYDDKQRVYSSDAPLTVEAFRKWVRVHSLPLVTDLTGSAELEDKLKRTDLPIVFFFLNRLNVKENAAILGHANDLALATRGEYMLAHFDANQARERMKDMGIPGGKVPDSAAKKPDSWSDEDDGEWEPPQIDDPTPRVVIVEKGGVRKYEIDSRDLTLEALRKGVEEHTKCVASFDDCKLTRNIKSEETPASNNDPVKIVTGNTFEKIVMDATKDVLIEFYAPWCGHCKSLEPIYKEFAGSVSASKNLVIAKMDGTANDIVNPKFEVTGFPTIYFKPAGKAPFLYNGDRTVKAFLEEIQSKATHPL